MNTDHEKLVIGILRCDRPVSERWQAALNALKVPEGLTVERYTVTSAGEAKNSEIDAARDEITARALKAKARYIFFLDDDVLCPPETLVRLASELAERSDARVMGGLYPQRIVSSTGAQMMVWKGDYEKDGSEWMDWEPNTVFRCDYLPMGCELIDTRIFAELRAPYFETVYIRRQAANPDGYVVRKVSEDFHFCQKVRRAGFEVWAHGGIICEHETPARKYLFGEYRTSEL